MAYNPESRLFSPSAEKLPEAEEALYSALVPDNKKRAIQLDEFADHYGTEAVARDKAYVQDRERKFAAKESPEVNQKFGELFEAIINYQIENSDMMGPNANVIVPSRFDDIANGIDTIVQFKEAKEATSHLALAIDVTASEMEIGKKFANMKESIKKGGLSKVKYFKSKNFRGELGPVARVVIGADHEITSDISDLILRFTRMQKALAENRRTKNTSGSAQQLNLEFREIRLRLGEHPLHGIILIEIREQLAASKKYAEKAGKPIASEECSKMLNIVNELIAEKKGLSDQIEDPNFPGNTDAVFRMIMENAHALSEAS
jgi:hypothetical protein